MYFSSPLIIFSRLVRAIARFSSLVIDLPATLERFIASRWVFGGGGTGPRLPSASRRLGVGRPFPTVGDSSMGGATLAPDCSEPSSAGLRRRKLTQAA